MGHVWDVVEVTLTVTHAAIGEGPSASTTRTMVKPTSAERGVDIFSPVGKDCRETDP